MHYLTDDNGRQYLRAKDAALYLTKHGYEVSHKALPVWVIRDAGLPDDERRFREADIYRKSSREVWYAVDALDRIVGKD